MTSTSLFMPCVGPCPGVWLPVSFLKRTRQMWKKTFPVFDCKRTVTSGVDTLSLFALGEASCHTVREPCVGIHVTKEGEDYQQPLEWAWEWIPQPQLSLQIKWQLDLDHSLTPKSPWAKGTQLSHNADSWLQETIKQQIFTGLGKMCYFTIDNYLGEGRLGRGYKWGQRPQGRNVLGAVKE